MKALAGGAGVLFALFAAPRLSAQGNAPPDPRHVTTVSGYCAAWNEPDKVRRDVRIAEIWDVNGEYSDPTPVSVTGRAALSNHIDGFVKQFAGSRISCSAPQGHHQSARFTWQIVSGDGVVRAAGMDYAEFAADGRLRRIVGFFGELPKVR